MELAFVMEGTISSGGVLGPVRLGARAERGRERGPLGAAARRTRERRRGHERRPPRVLGERTRDPIEA